MAAESSGSRGVFKFDGDQLAAALKTIEGFKQPPPRAAAPTKWWRDFDKLERVLKIAGVVFAFCFAIIKYFAYEAERNEIALEKSRTELSLKELDLRLQQVRFRGEVDRNLEWTVTMNARAISEHADDGTGRYVATFGMTFKNIGQVPIRILRNVIVPYLGTLIEDSSAKESVLRVNVPGTSDSVLGRVQWKVQESIEFVDGGQGGLAKLNPGESSGFTYEYVVRAHKDRYLAFRSTFESRILDENAEDPQQANHAAQILHLAHLPVDSKE